MPTETNTNTTAATAADDGTPSVAAAAKGGDGGNNYGLSSSSSDSDDDVHNKADDDDGDNQSGTKGQDDDDGNGDESNDPLSDENIKKMSVDLDVLMVLLQDEGKLGKPNKKDGTRHYEYPQLKTLAGKYYDKFKEMKNMFPFSANKSRETNAILVCLVNLRQHMDKHRVLPSLLAHLKNHTGEKVFVLNNDETGGQQPLITACHSHFSNRQVKQQGQRNGSVAIRVVYCLCHPSIRAAAAYFLANKKSRDDLDQATGTTRQAFGELVYALHRNAELEIERPDVMDLPNHDPRKLLDPLTVDLNRKWKWILETWENYVRPKYKKVLVKWNKLTGNGDRTLKNFVNYCNVNRDNSGLPVVWLVWVYYIDMQAHFLLASAAGHRPPAFVAKEAGFGNGDGDGDGETLFDNSSDNFAGEVDSLRTPRSGSSKKARLEEGLEQLAEHRQKLSSLVSKLDERMAVQTTQAKDPLLDGYAQIEKLNEAKTSIADDDDFTPNTKAKLVSKFTERKKSIAQKLINDSEATEAET